MSMENYAIVIDGDLIECSHLYKNDLRDGNDSYILFESDDAAEQAAADTWRDRARYDPDELIALIGAEKIVEMWTNGTTLEDFISETNADDEFGCGETSLDVTGMLEYVKDEFPELSAWIDEIDAECGSDYSLLDEIEDGDLEEDEDEEETGVDMDEDDDLDVDDQNRVIELLQGWQELIDECGYTPTIAYKR